MRVRHAWAGLLLAAALASGGGCAHKWCCRTAPTVSAAPPVCCPAPAPVAPLSTPPPGYPGTTSFSVTPPLVHLHNGR